MIKNKKGQLSVGQIVIIIMGIMTCLAIAGSIIDTQHQLTDLQTSTNDTTDLAGTGCMLNLVGDIDHTVNETNSACNITVDAWYPTGDWRLNDSQCYISSVVVRNDTVAFVEDTDYEIFASQGIIRMLNSTGTLLGSANTTYVTFNYCAEGYNKDAGSRGIARTISLFAFLALLAFVAIGLRNEWFKV